MAGSSQRGRAHEMGAEADDALMQLNALAPMALTKVRRAPHSRNTRRDTTGARSFVRAVG